MNKLNGTAPKTAAQTGNDKAQDKQKAQSIALPAPAAEKKEESQIAAPAMVVPPNSLQAQEQQKPDINTVIADVKRRHETLQKLEELRETREELLAFKFSASGIREYFHITDGGKNNFKTHNADFIQKVYMLCLDTVDAKIIAAEAELTA